MDLSTHARKTISFILILAFLSTNQSYGQAIYPQNLAPDVVSVDEPLDENPDVARATREEAKIAAFACLVADHFIRGNGGAENLKSALASDYRNSRTAAPGLEVDFDSIIFDRSSGIVTVPYHYGETARAMRVCQQTGRENPGATWRMGGYDIVLGDQGSDERDLKGLDAPSTNPLIQKFIQNKQLVEVYIDPETDALKANMVVWVKNYASGITPPALYRGNGLSVTQLLDTPQRRNLEAWMRAHPVRGSPVKFRIVLGNASIGWDERGVEHSNIAHAGLRDRSIYLGSILLRHLFTNGAGPTSLRTSVLDEDEYQHLIGKTHGEEESYLERLRLIGQAMGSLRFEEIRRAIDEKDVYYLLDELRGRLANPQELLDMLSIINDISLGMRLYPVEGTYPIKHAVSLLTGEEQDKFLDILKGNDAADYRKLKVADELMLMLADTATMADWVDIHAPNLKGRSLWQISPEIWHEAGGLARVMQYHGAGIKSLLWGSDVRFRQIEPHYQNRIGTEDNAVPFSYKTDITFPIRDLEEIDLGPFTVTMKKLSGGRYIDTEVEVIVSRGRNSLGVEVYLIKGRDGYYTHSLYNYGNLDEENKDIPSWEEFSVFYSKASLELVRRIESLEKEEKEKQGGKWKAPVIHLNDSQVALVSVYRKIELDKEKEQEREKTKNGEGFEVDPVLDGAVIAFTTHTYRNRKTYSGPGVGRSGDMVLSFMDIPQGYREYFERDFQNTYDMASAGLRTADWQGAVSRAHRDDVSGYDDWINSPVTESMKKFYKGTVFDLIGIANGDDRARTAEVFRKIMREVSVSDGDVDIEHPSPDDVKNTKREAKRRLKLAQGQECYSTHKYKRGEPRTLLDPDQMVVSYSGRLVGEKAGRKRAFTDGNILKLLEAGIQVVIYGNKQTNSSESDQLYGHLIMLSERIKHKKYPGRLIFVPRFSLTDQRALLAASDVQVQDSDPRSEAAGFTEADISATGGIEVAISRDDNTVGEGLFEAQGVPLDFTVNGRGNVVVPDKRISMDNLAEAYLTILLRLNDKYDRDELKHYQASSIRLSRVLEAINTSASYIREFNRAVEAKTLRRERERMEEIREKLEAEERSFLTGLYRPEQERDPAGYNAYSVVKTVFQGNPRYGADLFFTGAGFQGYGRNLAFVCDIFNSVIGKYAELAGSEAARQANQDGRMKNIMDRESAKDFLRFIIREAATLASQGEDADRVAVPIEIMAAQTLTILSWIDRGVKGAERIRLTSDIERMTANEKRGRGYIDSETLPPDTAEVLQEGGIGFYWRGHENAKKLGGNILSLPGADEEQLQGSGEALVMYIMDHGFVKVPGALRAATESGRVSTLHETFFANDTLPGTPQTTSTGAGHFQGNKLDIKYVTEGAGVQVNVRYNRDGAIGDVVAQVLEPGAYTLALPGYVDYMINLGGLRFNDMSIALSQEEARKFDPQYDETRLEALQTIADTRAKRVPYLGAVTNGAPRVVETMPAMPPSRWIPALRAPGAGSLAELYANMRSIHEMDAIVRMVGDSFREAASWAQEGAKRSVVIPMAEASRAYADERASSMNAPAVRSRDAVTGIHGYIDDSMDFLAGQMHPSSATLKLVRVPVEALESAGEDNVAGFLAALQSSPKIMVELYSANDSTREVTDSVYAGYGIHKRDTAGFTPSRANTVTVFPVEKGEQLPGSKNNTRWTLGGLKVSNTIISPVGLNYDRSGMIRSIILGLRLSEIAERQYDADDFFVRYTLSQYMDLCLSSGIANFDITTYDIVNIAAGQLVDMVESLNKLIRYLPITPLDPEELKRIYEHAKEALIRA